MSNGPAAQALELNAVTQRCFEFTYSGILGDYQISKQNDTLSYTMDLGNGHFAGGMFENWGNLFNEIFDVEFKEWNRIYPRMNNFCMNIPMYNSVTFREHLAVKMWGAFAGGIQK